MSVLNNLKQMITNTNDITPEQTFWREFLRYAGYKPTAELLDAAQQAGLKPSLREHREQMLSLALRMQGATLKNWRQRAMDMAPVIAN